MDGSINELSKYRWERAKEDLDTAQILLEKKKYKQSINRSYYAVFHTMRAVTALEQFDTSKHSGVIAYFNRTYVKEGIFDRELSKLIEQTYRLREKSDYLDFYTASKKEAEAQLEKAEKFLNAVELYLKERWEKPNA